MKREGEKTLWQKFNRRAKRMAAVGLAGLSLCAGFTPVAAAASPPVEQVQQLQAPKPAKIKYEFSQARLDKIEAKMAQTELGRALLQFGKDENIRIEMSDSKVMNPHPFASNQLIKGKNYSSYILLNGEVKSDDEVMITLAHELRHSWHEKTIKSGDLTLDPKHDWLKRRIQEADAFAFEIHFAYEYEQATGKTLDLGDRFNCMGRDDYACLLQDYTWARHDKHKTVGQAYSELLAKTLDHVHRQSYDASFVTDLDHGWGMVAAVPALGVAWSDKLLNPAPDSDFVREMRQVATAGLHPGVDPAALTAWQDADFLSFDKTGGKPDKKDQKIFDGVQANYDKARLAWKNLVDEMAKPSGNPATVPPSPPPPAPTSELANPLKPKH